MCGKFEQRFDKTADVIIIIIMIIIIIIICCSVLEDEQKWAYLTLSFDLGKYFSETEGCVQDL